MSESKKASGKQPVQPEFRAAQRWNIVWVVPVIALLIGGWLVYRNYASKGPIAHVTFETADGLAAEKTEIRCRSVKVGVVKNVELSQDLKAVDVEIQMEPHAAHLLRAESRFWVVRPRVSGADISGLGTLLTGAYIELEPGVGAAGATSFLGLEEPPPTNRNVPGRRLILKAEEAGSLAVGSTVFYRGVEVGRIESRKLGPDGRDVIYDAFIQAEFMGLITENTRFWNTSGVDISAGATGLKVRTPSFTAMVSGGASFGVPHGLPAGGPISGDGAVFKLYDDQDEAENTLFHPDSRLLLMFEQSVLGLSKGAAVRFRGINVGRVLEVSFDLSKAKLDARIPVLVEVDSSIICRGMEQQTGKDSAVLWEAAVAKGLRASLKSENLLVTGRYVDLDCYPTLPVVALAREGEYAVLPTVTAGFAQLEEKFTVIMNKLESLPLEETMASIGKAADEAAVTIKDARGAIEEIKSAVASAQKMLEDPEMRAIPADLRETLDKLQKAVASIGPDGAMQGDLLRTLDELRASLRSIKSLSNTIDEKPSSLLFGKDSSGNPTPRAPRGNR